MRCAILPLSVVALLTGCASSQQARVEPLANPVGAMEPAAVSTAVAAIPVAVTTAASAESQSDSTSSTATINISTDPTYYGAHDLDMQPQPLHNIEPDYPAEADSQGVSGKVVLQLKLEADGRVSAIDVVSANPPDVFNESTAQAIRDVPFAPGQKNGRPVRALFVIEVVYDWEGSR